MKAEHGSAYSPACAGTYVDALCSDPTTAYVEVAITEQVLFTCSPSHACPANSITEADAVKGMADNNLWTAYKPIAGGSLYTLRDNDNRVVTEFADSLPSRDNIYIGNVAVASYLGKQPGVPGAWRFHSSDHLGTIRLTVDAATGGSGFLEQPKYWPYGDLLSPVVPPLQRVGFAAMERDTEDNHFYDHARHHDFNLGRFVVPDRVQGHARDSQSWNRYAYARNNPVAMVDRNGLCSQPIGVGGDWVGFCAEAYIATQRFGGVGFGDGRGPSASDPTLTSRVQLQWIVNTKTGEIQTQPTIPQMSRIEIPILGFQIAMTGTANGDVTKLFHVDGATGMTASFDAQNGFAWAFPIAPYDSIRLNMQVVVGADGQVRLVGSRTAFPTTSVWEYQEGKRPLLLNQSTESSSPSGLHEIVPLVPCFAGQTVEGKPCVQ